MAYVLVRIDSDLYDKVKKQADRKGMRYTPELNAVIEIGLKGGTDGQKPTIKGN